LGRIITPRRGLALPYRQRGALVFRHRIAVPPSGNTINASSASQGDVETAIAAASVGDTVQVPAGAGTWNTLALAKAIHLVGAGIGSTNITLGTGNSITKQAAGVTYVRGFSFGRSTGGNAVHGFTIGGSWLSASPVVIENCDFAISASGLFQLSVAGGVVIANCAFDAELDDSIIRPKNVDTSTPNQASTSESWSTDDSIGASDTSGDRNIYVEDCYFHGGGNQGMDFDDASRGVVRHCRLVFSTINSHGLATSEVGCRHMEVYDNELWHAESSGESGTADIANVNKAIWNRGGVWVITDNDIDAIAGGFWGDKPELAVDIRAQQDDSGGAYSDFDDGRAWLSAGTGTYPRQHQASVNWSSGEPSNSGYYIDPLYFWNNVGSGVVSNAPQNFQNGGNWGSHAGCFTADTDYFFGTARPGYTKYTYPHPLRQTVGQAF
jgi:hypothetical protein